MALVDGALALASAGWRVFPVSASTKRPRTPHGHLDATSDVERVVAWAALFNEGGGIATPTGQGLLVIDIDPRNGGEVPTWAPKTRAVRTQSGGFHLHYAIDRDIKSRAGLFGPGVDSKSHGGYVLLPPSPGYVWATGPEQGRTRLSADWLEQHGARFGLCRTLDWEWWHFEWRAAWQSARSCPPLAQTPAEAPGVSGRPQG